MSIAVSACVAPSRLLRACLGGAALVHLGAAAGIVMLMPGRIAGVPWCVTFFLIAALFSLYGCVSATKAVRIDVSGTGTLRLTVQQEMGADPVATEGIVVTLLPGTLVWPQLMLLRLGAEQGGATVVPVLRDSLAPADYRALRVAVGSLGAGLAPVETTNEIL